MGWFKILSTPLSALAPNTYKGLYRSEPFPKNDSTTCFLELWERYVQYQEDCLVGNVSVFPLNELKELAVQASKISGEVFEVIYMSEDNNCPHNAIYYGIDVIGSGGYSLIGDGLFIKGEGGKKILSVIGEYFRKKLNSYSLFSTDNQALCFKRTLEELTVISPNLIENEAWKCVHVFGLFFTT